jgi:N-acetylmuramoyl-L-alanine amidase
LHCENKVCSAQQLRHDSLLAPRVAALDDLISWAVLNARFLGAAVSLTAFCALTAGHLAGDLSAQAGQAQPATQGTAAYTIVSRDGRRPLPVRAIGGQEMFALDDLARVFDLTLREDVAAGGLTVTTKSQTIVLSAGQALASVGGRLISLPAAPVREGRAWFVPVDFVSRALAPATGTRVDLRKPARLIIAGDLRMPQITGRLEPLGALVRLTLDVAPATPHAIAQEGARLVIRFEADALDATLPSPTVPDLIQSIRPGDSPASLVVDLGPRFASFRTADLPGDRGAGRIQIDVAAQTTEPAQQPAAPQTPTAPAPELPPLVDLAPAGGMRTIVIDAGHGGGDDGARGANGTLEKNVTLSVARRLKGALESRLGVRVILTREGDQSVGLDERAALANNNKADLFVSLHANASVRQAMSGAEVFFLSLVEYGEEGQRVAQGVSEVLPVFGGASRDIEVTPWEMAQARHIERSAALARAAEASLRAAVPMSPRAIEQAPFRVLVGVNMPAIIVEMAFLSNPQQEREATGDTFQNGIVQALVNGIVRFRDEAPRPTGTAAAAPPRAAGREGR